MFWGDDTSFCKLSKSQYSIKINLKFAKELKNVFGLFINMNEFIYDEKPDNPNFAIYCAM